MKLNNINLFSLFIFSVIVSALGACAYIPPTPVTPTSPRLQNGASQLMTLLSQMGNTQHYLLPGETEFDKIPQDPQNPLTADKVRLGKMLFHETALSFLSKNNHSGSWSCASCHFAEAGFQDQRVQSLADGGQGNGRQRKLLAENIPHANLDSPNLRSPSILNVAFQHNLLWNGMAGGTGDNLNHQARWDKTKPHGFNYLGLDGAETQAIIALGAHRQTHDHQKYASAQEVLTIMDSYPEYKALLAQEFPDEPVCRETLGKAIAAYERTVLPTQAPFQRFLRGDQTAMSSQQIQGAQVFFGKAQCANCHTGPALNQENYYALGFNDMQVEFGPAPDAATRKGRGGFTGRAEDEYKFKVPQLYNLKSVSSLGHGGSFQSDAQQSALEKIIRYKLKGKSENPEVPQSQLSLAFTLMAKESFSETEIQSLVSFIENGLYDPNIKRYEPKELPSGQKIINND